MKTARLSFVALALAASFGASAAMDVKEYPTGYFVDVDANKYSAPFYRWKGDDWAWTHGGIAGSFSSASVSVSAFDVDAGSGEVDNIYAKDSGVWTLLGSLAGASDIWSYTTFSLGSSFYDDINAGLEVMIEIDAATAGSWAVTLAKSVLIADGGTLPPPIPGVIPEPETYAMLLAGLGLLGFVARRRKQKLATA